MGTKLWVLFTFPPLLQHSLRTKEKAATSDRYQRVRQLMQLLRKTEWQPRQQGEFPGLCHSDPLHCFHSFSCLFSYILEAQTSAVATNLNYGRIPIFGGTTTQPVSFTGFRHLKGNCTPQACLVAGLGKKKPKQNKKVGMSLEVSSKLKY